MSLFSEETEKAIVKSYSDFKKNYKEFNYDDNYKVFASEPLTLSLAKEMVSETIIHAPVRDISHRKYLGATIVFVKGFLRRLARPLVKILLVRQQRMNDLTVALAYAVASLELRVVKLEEKLDRALESKGRQG